MSLSQEGTAKKKMPSSFEIFSHSLIASGNNINNNEFHNFPSLSYLNQAIYYIKLAIEELHYYNLHKNNPNDIVQYIISNKMISSFHAFFYAKEKVIQFKINEILNHLIKEEYFDELCPLTNALEFCNIALRNIYKNEQSSLVFQLLIRKTHQYIEYLKEKDKENTMNIILYNELLDSFPIPHSSSYYNFKNKLEETDIYSLVKSNEDDTEISNGLVIIDKLTECINELFKYIEQYEIIYKIAKDFIPPLTSKLFLYQSEMYLKLGNFLLNFLFLNKHTIDASLPENGDVIPGHNYITILDDSLIYDLSQYSFLNNKVYTTEYFFDILQSFPNEMISVCLLYIKPMIKLDTDFQIQFIIYRILKLLYFIYPYHRHFFSEYISKCLYNLCLFKELDDWNKGLESREFAYYLLSRDQQIGKTIKSVTSQPVINILQHTILLRDLDIDTGYMTKMVVDSGTKKSIEMNTNVEDSIIFIEFYIEDCKSINVNVYKNEETVRNQICTMKKIKSLCENDSSKIKTIRIILYAKELGSYEVEFDNEYSWITMKTIHYKIVLLRPFIE